MILPTAEARQVGDRLAAPIAQLPGRCALTSSTPEALWSSRSVRLLKPAAVEVRGLQADAPGGRGALNGLDLSVPVGARLLLVSRPEASATLLLRVLAGLARPISGRISLAGLARSAETPQGWARRVGYVGPNPAIYPWLSPLEALALAARLAGMERHEAAARVEEVIEQFGLADAARRPMTRSGPMIAQRTAMAAALLPEPEILLLDEPLRSVDPDQRTRLLSLRPRRVTVILASRYPASEAGIVGQVALLRAGRLVMHAGLDELANAGLPLSARGIEALADRRALGMSGGRPAAPPAAAPG